MTGTPSDTSRFVGSGVSTSNQGLPLFHFSARIEPFLSVRMMPPKHLLNTPYSPPDPP